MPITPRACSRRPGQGCSSARERPRRARTQTSLACGRFAPDVCAQYQATAASGTPTPALLDLLAASSPAQVVGQIKAPTLLVQGEADSLFPLSEADANARAIAAGGTPVKIVWYSGGHDSPGSSADQDRLRSLTLSWFDRYLKHDGSKPDTSFQFAESGTGISLQDGSVKGSTLTTPGYPGLAGTPAAGTTSVTLSGSPQDVVAPAGGFPAAITSLPGLGSALGQLSSTGLVGSLGGASNQDATFSSASPARRGPRRRLSDRHRARHLCPRKMPPSSRSCMTYRPTRARRCFLSSSRRRSSSAACRREEWTSASSCQPSSTEFAAGHRMRLVVSTTDQAYQLPLTTRTYGSRWRTVR